MEGNDELNEINITNCNSYYFDDLIKIKDFYSDHVFWMKNHTNIILLPTFRTKL